MNDLNRAINETKYIGSLAQCSPLVAGGYDQRGPEQPRPPLLDEVAQLKAEVRNMNEVLNKVAADFDSRICRIECTLGIQR